MYIKAHNAILYTHILMFLLIYSLNPHKTFTLFMKSCNDIVEVMLRNRMGLSMSVCRTVNRLFRCLSVCEILVYIDEAQAR